MDKPRTFALRFHLPDLLTPTRYSPAVRLPIVPRGPGCRQARSAALRRCFKGMANLLILLRTERQHREAVACKGADALNVV
jgi:hypothetical protein